MFLIVDTDTKATRAVANPKREQADERCLPLDFLAIEKIDVVVVSAIGRGALGRLSAASIAAYHGAHGTAGQVLDAVVRGDLLPVLPEDTCGGKAGPHGIGCQGHGQDGGANEGVQLGAPGKRGV
jgi:predicted Fe-Mo cluster-binding NifX family protein